MSNGLEPEVGGFSQAQLSLAEAQRLINEEAQANPDKKKSKGRTRNILSNVNRVVNALEHVGSLHPAAKVVFEIYKGLLKLENDRRDNSEQIVILFHSMARTLSVLSYLDKVILVADDPLTRHLGEVLNAYSVTMEEFGDLSDLYYNKCKQPVVRFLKATEFKGKIQHFEKRFSVHRRDLQEILVIRNEARGGEMIQEMEQLRLNTERIIARLGEPSSEQEIQAQEIVRVCGRDRVLHDKAKLEELSTLVGGGKVSGNTQALLDTNLDDLLSANMEQFHRKLDSSMTQISDSVHKSRDAILKKLDSGPHELIDDPDVQTVWRANSWKLSVKCRHFVDELSNHFEDKFRNEAADEGANCNDHWTLPIFSKVMHHPAIGDAIDEDGSGFISVYEVNCWLKDRPTGWSVPEWLVYWAIGWEMNNVKFNEAIVDSLEDIKERCKSVIELTDDEDVQHHIQQYLQKVQIMEKISSWSDSAAAEDTQDLSHDAEAKLQNLLDQSSRQQVTMITERLEELKWILDDPADIPVLLGGSDARIEQVFLSIAQLILGKQLEELASRELEDGDWEIMTETLEMLIAVFHDRMQSLLRGWRAQKLNVELHITCFAGGIYNGWYTAFYHPSGEMKRILEKNPNSHPAGSQDSPTDTLSTILVQMSHLTERVDHVDSRIDDIFSMLRTLLEANSTSMSHAKKEDLRNSVLGIHTSPPKPTSAHEPPKPMPSYASKIADHVKTGRKIMEVGGMMAKVANKANGLLNGELPDDLSIPQDPNPVGGIVGFANKTGALLNGDIPEDFSIPEPKFPKRLLSMGGKMAGLANSAGALLDGKLPAGNGIPNEVVSDGDDFDFIVDDYAAGTDGQSLEFPRIKDAPSRSQTQLTSPDTEETHPFPEQQTPQEYGYPEVLVAERPEPFNDFYNTAISKGVSIDPSGLINGSPVWPTSAGVAKKYVDYFQDRPHTAPIVSTTDDMMKKVKRKKSDLRGGIKGVKDSIRTRLTSFGSKSAGQDEREDGERSQAVSSTSHPSSESANHGRPQEIGALPQRQELRSAPPQRREFNTMPQRREVGPVPQRQEVGNPPQRQEFRPMLPSQSVTSPQGQEFDLVDPRRHQWDGRDHRGPRTGAPLRVVNGDPNNNHHPENARRSDGPPNANHHGRGGARIFHHPSPTRRSDGAAPASMIPSTPTSPNPSNEQRARHPTGPRSVAGVSPVWRNGWNGADQWDEGRSQQQQHQQQHQYQHQHHQQYQQQQQPAPNYGTAL